ncbi:MAG: MATE family efflux transporter [Bacteroidales bacterium]
MSEDISGKQDAEKSSFWLDLKEALAGTEKDFTEMRLRKAVFLLAIPMVLEMMMESIFAIVDIYFVSGLGADAVAAVGITESMMTIIYAIALGISVSATAVVSRRIGEKEPGKASQAAAQAIICGMAVSLLLAIPGIFFASDLLSLMGASEGVISTGHRFTSIMMTGNIVIVLLFIHNAIFRGAGDAAIAMRVLLISNIINIVLDPVLIYGIGSFNGFGVTGAAMATNIGRGTGVLIQLWFLFKGHSRIRLILRNLIPSPALILKILRLSLGGIGQNLIATSSWVVMMTILAAFGANVIAGYTIAIRIIVFVLLPSWGLSNAASTLVGQNLGAGKLQRASISGWITGIANFVFLGIIGLVLSLFPSFFVNLFNITPEVAAKATEGLRIVSYGLSLYGIGMVMVQAINGAGDTITPTWINFFCFWLVEIPLAWLLARHSALDERGVYYAILIAESLLSLIAIVVFTRGKWKLRKV